MADSVQGSDESGQPADVKVEKDPVLADINKRILDAFDIFDRDGNKTVDVRYKNGSYSLCCGRWRGNYCTLL